MDLYHNNMSTCAQKVRLVLREKGLAVREHHLNLRAGDQNTPDYLRMNPKGVVPTLVDHDTPIVESTVICEYLEDAYPQVSLRPEDPLQRARMRWWTQLPDAGFHHSVGQTCVAIAFRHQMMAGAEKTARLVNARKDPVVRERLRLMLEMGIKAPASRMRFATTIDSSERSTNSWPTLPGLQATRSHWPTPWPSLMWYGWNI